MTLEDAKKAISERYDAPMIEETYRQKIEASAYRRGISVCRDILAKVDSPEPDEEGRAVLWLPIELLPESYKNGPTYPGFIGGNSNTGFVGDCCYSTLETGFLHYGAPVELTHFQPFPTAPVTEAKKLGWGA